MIDPYTAVKDCGEAHAYYTTIGDKHRAFSQGVRVCTSIQRACDAIANAFLMHAETIAKERG